MFHKMQNPNYTELLIEVKIFYNKFLTRLRFIIQPDISER